MSTSSSPSRAVAARPAASFQPAPELADTPVPGASAWGLARRLLFRFACVYFVLYALPFPFQQLLTVIDAGLDALGLAAADPGRAWVGMVRSWLGEIGSAWQTVTSWVGAQHGVEVVHQPTGSGDTMHAHVQLFVSLGAAVIAAGAWSLLEAFGWGRRGHPRLAPWLHLGARWYLAFFMLVYGLIKLYATQFPYPSLTRMTNEIGDTSPMGLVWTFMGASKPYEIFAGLGETIGGLLLFSRRTSLLGAVVVIGVMTNVAALNWMYDVPVKLFSSHLLLIGVLLLIPDAGRLWRLFVTNRPVPPADHRLVRTRWLRIALAVFGWLFVAGHLVEKHVSYSSMGEMRAVERPELYGVWRVESMRRDGEEVVANDLSRWRFLALDLRGMAWAETLDGKRPRFHYVEDLPAGILSLAPRRGPEAPADMPVWTFTRGEKTVTVPNPRPTSMADYNRPVEVVRPTLTLRGLLGDQELELELVKREFRLARGFHFVQEMPYNR